MSPAASRVRRTSRNRTATCVTVATPTMHSSEFNMLDTMLNCSPDRYSPARVQ